MSMLEAVTMFFYGHNSYIVIIIFIMIMIIVIIMCFMELDSFHISKRKTDQVIQLSHAIIEI